MPKPVAQLEQAESAFLTPDLVVMVEVRNVRKLLAQAQWRILSIHADRGLEGPEVPREVEMLVLREKLIGENQDRILGEGFFDCLEVGRGDLFRQVDIADFSSEAGRDRIDGYGHDQTRSASEKRYGPLQRQSLHQRSMRRPSPTKAYPVARRGP